MGFKKTSSLPTCDRIVQNKKQNILYPKEIHQTNLTFTNTRPKIKPTEIPGFHEAYDMTETSARINIV